MFVIIGVYPAMSNSQKQLANCLIRRETSVVLIVFNNVIYHTHAYIVFVSHCCSAWIGHYKSYISWSVTVHNYTLSSQCSLTAQYSNCRQGRLNSIIGPQEKQCAGAHTHTTTRRNKTVDNIKHIFIVLVGPPKSVFKH